MIDNVYLILFLILTLSTVIVNIILVYKTSNTNKDYLLTYWKIIEESINTNLKLYDIIVNYELVDYDSATETYMNLKNEFTKHVIENLQGKVIQEAIKCFYGNKTNFIKYLNDRFDNSYYKKYIALQPTINNKI